MRNSFYDRLTIEKRAELLTKALVHDDYEEVERLIEAIPNPYELIYPLLINTWNMHKITLYACGQLSFNFGKLEAIEEIQKGILNLIGKYPNASSHNDLKNIVNQIELTNKKAIISATKCCWEGFKRFSQNILDNDAKELIHVWAEHCFKLINEVEEIKDIKVSQEEIIKLEKVFEQIWKNISKKR